MDGWEGVSPLDASTPLYPDERQRDIENTPAPPVQERESDERPPTLTFGGGDYSCASCGFGMKGPCRHWKQFLAAQPEQQTT